MDFDPHELEQCNEILEAEHFELIWDSYTGKVARGLPENRGGEWLLKWNVGQIHLGGFKDKPTEARHRAALFMYLTKRDIAAILAKELTKTYFAGTLPIEEKP